MIGPGVAGNVMEAVAEGFDTGLVGTLGVTIDDNLGNNVVPRTTANISQIQTVGTLGVYRYLGVYPADIGTYTITWDDGVISASEYIEVELSPAGDWSATLIGPCSAWTSADEVADCCGIELGSDTEEALELVAAEAGSILFELSGRIYPGLCGPVTVRPCSDRNPCYAPGRSDYLRSCGCQGLSTVLLAGYPVQEIAQVLIDGEVLPPSEYRLDGYRHLVRLADADGRRQVWPACQRLDLENTEEHTFSVSYFYGLDPPSSGVSAAARLACELYRACTPGSGECALPAGTTRVTRTGITIERRELATFLTSGSTGLVQIDAFLAAHGGTRRRPAIWSPDGPRYARRLGA